MFALFINAAILVLVAAVFHWSGHQDVAEIQDAYKLLSPLLGVELREHPFRHRVACFRTELDSHWHARRSGRDGRFSQHPDHAVVAPAHHATV